jgi:hypothetical protein
MDGDRLRVYAQYAVDEPAGDRHVPAALSPNRNQPGHDPASCCTATGPSALPPQAPPGPATQRHEPWEDGEPRSGARDFHSLMAPVLGRQAG